METEPEEQNGDQVYVLDETPITEEEVSPLPE
jgi:hypothetical protein